MKLSSTYCLLTPSVGFTGSDTFVMLKPPIDIDAPAAPRSLKRALIGKYAASAVYLFKASVPDTAFAKFVNNY